MGMDYNSHVRPGENPNWEHQYDETLARMELQREAEDAGRSRHGSMRWGERLVRPVRRPNSS